MTETKASYHPVFPDGDVAMLLPQKDIAGALDKILDQGLLPDGSFAVTDGTHDSDDYLTVIADSTGEHTIDALKRSGYDDKAIKAYADRIRIMQQPESLRAQTVEPGETKLVESGSTETLLVNATGELGKPNLVGFIDCDRPGRIRSYGLIESNGHLYAVARRQIDDHVTYFPEEIDDGKQPDVPLPFWGGLREAAGLSVVDIYTTGPQNVILYAPGQSKEVARELPRRGLIKGILQRRQSEAQQTSTPHGFADFDVSAADKAITEAIEFDKRQKAEAEQAQYRKDTAEIIETKYKEQTSIEALTAKHPEAGNFFQPGASVFEDKLFIDTLSRYGVGQVSERDGKAQINLSEVDQRQIRETPELQAEIKQLLKARLEAWIQEQPAAVIMRRYGAYRRIEDTEAPAGLNRQTSGPLMEDHAFTDRRTVANTEVPERILNNTSKKNARAVKYPGEPAHLRSREVAVNMALDMLSGDFWTSHQPVDIEARTDPQQKVIIYEPVLGHHRSTAQMIAYGEI